MVALAPIADSVPVQYPPKSFSNGMVHSDVADHSDQAPIMMDAVNLTPSTPLDSPDPLILSANGKPSIQQQNGTHGGHLSTVTPETFSNELTMASEILKVIESYGIDYEKNGGSWKGLESFIPTVLERVEKQEPIRMILPAFPFKSPNARDKVLGQLPDFGDELALAHLNGLCENIGQVYKPGADVYISSDGLVYNGTCLND